MTDKSIDEEEYILFRMNREKVVGENFREGSMEVAFELWTEQMILSRLQRRFPPLSREAISEWHGLFPYCIECRSSSEFRWYHGHVSSP